MRLEPWGTCVYCDGPPDGSIEHIIPESLNGRMELPNATCADCKQVINREIETPLMGFHYKNSRNRHGYRSKRRGAKNKSIIKGNHFYFLANRSIPPFQKAIPMFAEVNPMTDVIYTYRIPKFLEGCCEYKENSIAVNFPWALRDVDKAEQKLRAGDQFVTSVKRQTPVFQASLMQRLIAKIACGAYCGLLRIAGHEGIRSIVLNGPEKINNPFIRSAPLECFPMKTREIRFFNRIEHGVNILYCAMNILPEEIPHIYFCRVQLEDINYQIDQSFDYGL
ncbi:hypothetical protein SAMN04488077_11168 [Roseovarius tolerans]|uniref:Uncharacterized protein n=1 Tax=Roseovarius tolerans TaxID=74031 RepID=A0A1H8DBL9_9RHOB|nr:HNH endonuclease [Roseovarius tolerans]SEN04649.1 hypothetical protein SAMN04488077_11168 [Roseovarius tolerans]